LILINALSIPISTSRALLPYYIALLPQEKWKEIQYDVDPVVEHAGVARGGVESAC